MRLNDLSLRTKVYGAFIIVLTLDVLSGCVAGYGLYAVNSEAASIRDRWLPVINSIGTLVSNIESYRLLEARALLTDDQKERLASEELLWDARDALFRTRTRLESQRPRADDIDRPFGQFDEVWRAYQDDSKRIVWHVFQGGEAARTARDIYNGQSRRHFIEARNALFEARKIFSDQARAATERGRQTFYGTIGAILAVTLLTVALSFTLGMLIVRGITGPVAGLTHAMRRIADDDLEQPIDSEGRLDEIGVMTDALGSLREQLRERRRLLALERENAEKLHAVERELQESERLAALGRMVAGVSHEINTPVGSAYTVATTLVETERDFRRLLDEGRLKKSDLDAFLDKIGRGSDLMVLTLEKVSGLIRTFKQVAIDQSTNSKRRFDLAELVRQTIETTTPSFKRRPFRIVTEIPEGITMDSYPGPLGQVLSNLIANAIIHGFETRQDGVIRIEAGQDGRTVRLVVIDNGKGILPEHMPHLFEPFFTTRFGQGGSGLGLNIVHSLVTSLLEGSIEVESTPGHGTAFMLTLPLAAGGDGGTAPEDRQPAATVEDP